MLKKAESRIDSDDIQMVVNKIKEHCNPEKIILFGSCAHNENHQGSDIDLLVIMDTDLRYYQQAARIRLMLDEELGVNFPMDIIVRSPQEMEKRLKQGDFFLKQVSEEGIVL